MGSAFSVTSPRKENTAGLADAPLDERERLTQNQPAKVPFDDGQNHPEGRARRETHVRPHALLRVLRLLTSLSEEFIGPWW